MNETFVRRDEIKGTLERFVPEAGMSYSLEGAAYITGVPRRNILHYCRSGLIQPIVEPPFEIMMFDETSIRTIRQIENLRAAYGVNLEGLRFIFDLLNQVEQLQEEIRFLRRI